MANALVLGTFDGVHLGHQAVIKATAGYNCIAVTFPYPPKIAMGGSLSLITTLERKCKRLKQEGVNEVCLLDFEKVRELNPAKFLDYLTERFNPTFIVCGFNYRFGKGALGDTSLLEEYCKAHGIAFKAVPPVTWEGKVVSSSNIRSLLAAGEVSRANLLLKEPFGFCSAVVKGDKRGGTIGFPTINQIFPEELTLPRFGVYQTKVTVEGKSYIGLTDIGHRPTFPVDYVICETFLRDFSGDLYDKEIELQFIKFLRPEQKFSSLSELKNAISMDLKSLKEE